MTTTTLLAIILAPLGAWLMSIPVRGLTRLIWRKLPDGRLKRILFSKQKWIDYPPGAKPWDQ